MPAGYLQLLAQLTKVGDYDRAAFEGEAAGQAAGWPPLPLRCPVDTPTLSCPVQPSSMRSRGGRTTTRSWLLRVRTELLIL